MKPMLPATFDPNLPLEFPLLATPKIDGIRALIANGRLVSRSLKLIPNERLRVLLESMLPEGADGEISRDGDFYDTTSFVMTKNAELDVFFKFYWFDWVYDSPDTPYASRVSAIKKYVAVNAESLEGVVVPLLPDVVRDVSQLQKYERIALSKGFEGVIIRRPEGRYKYGRSTLRDALLIKIKTFADAEATITGFEELVRKDGSMGNTLGAIVAATEAGVNFKIGSGFTERQRCEIWNDRKCLVGKYVKFKYSDYNNKTAPRFPIFIGVRHFDDLTDG